MDVDTGLDLLTAKLGPYLVEWAKHKMKPEEVHRALRRILQSVGDLTDDAVADFVGSSWRFAWVSLWTLHLRLALK